jgi:hypothetical protein
MSDYHYIAVLTYGRMARKLYLRQDCALSNLSIVLVNDAAQEIVAQDGAGWWACWIVERRLLSQPLMRSRGIVMVDVGSQHATQMPFIDDQELILNILGARCVSSARQTHWHLELEPESAEYRSPPLQILCRKLG